MVRSPTLLALAGCVLLFAAGAVGSPKNVCRVWSASAATRRLPFGPGSHEKKAVQARSVTSMVLIVDGSSSLVDPEYFPVECLRTAQTSTPVVINLERRGRSMLEWTNAVASSIHTEVQRAAGQGKGASLVIMGADALSSDDLPVLNVLLDPLDKTRQTISSNQGPSSSTAKSQFIIILRSTQVYRSCEPAANNMRDTLSCLWDYPANDGKLTTDAMVGRIGKIVRLSSEQASTLAGANCRSACKDTEVQNSALSTPDLAPGVPTDWTLVAVGSTLCAVAIATCLWCYSNQTTVKHSRRAKHGSESEGEDSDSETEGGSSHSRATDRRRGPERRDVRQPRGGPKPIVGGGGEGPRCEGPTAGSKPKRRF